MAELAEIGVGDIVTAAGYPKRMRVVRFDKHDGADYAVCEWSIPDGEGGVKDTGEAFHPATLTLVQKKG